MNKEILDGIGKNARKRFLSGELSESEIKRMYSANKKECDDYPEFGVPLREMCADLKSCHNPLLIQKLQFLIDEFKRKQKLSSEQNKRSLEILGELKQTACGIGLRNVEKCLEWSKDLCLENRILCTLLHLEWTNLAAKQFSQIGRKIYGYKERLLLEVAPLMDEAGWKYGISSHAGKNASGIIYVYLPNGEQLSWHCGYEMFDYFPEIEAEWDGKVCSTLTKILDYINSIGLVKHSQAA